MKYPRTARIFRGQLDAAPFAGVLFLVLLFVMLTTLVYTTPGVRIELPSAGRVAAPGMPTVRVAVDAKGQYFYENQMLDADTLRDRLTARVKLAPEPLALEVWADRQVTLETLNRLTQIAVEAGIREAWQATLPRLFEAPAANRADVPQK